MADAPFCKGLPGIRRRNIGQLGNAIADAQDAAYASHRVHYKFARLQIRPLEFQLQGVIHYADWVFRILKNIVNRLACGGWQHELVGFGKRTQDIVVELVVQPECAPIHRFRWVGDGGDIAVFVEVVIRRRWRGFFLNPDGWFLCVCGGFRSGFWRFCGGSRSRPLLWFWSRFRSRLRWFLRSRGGQGFDSAS